MKVETVPLKSIKVGKRFREELGDLASLAQSIREKGILHPILVDTSMNLLAGQRRLEASALAGLSVIPVIKRKVTGELDAREIELLENIARRDMSWSEKARLERAIWDMKKEQDPNWNQEKHSIFMDQSKGMTDRRLQLATIIDDVPEIAAIFWRLLVPDDNAFPDVSGPGRPGCFWHRGLISQLAGGRDFPLTSLDNFFLSFFDP